MSRRIVHLLIGAAAIAGLVLLLPGIAGRWTAGDRTTLRIDDPAQLGLGQRIYETHCAACHGARLEGQPNWQRRGDDGLLPAPPHDASGHTWHHADELLLRIPKHGVAKAAGMADYATAMPIYDGVLSDDEIVAVLSWIKSQWPADVRAKHDRINQQARATP